MAFQKGNTVRGSRKGVPNRATTDVREAIAKIAQRNVAKVQEWLAEIEDPAKRVDLFLKLCEYHIPKLGRTELVGDAGKPMEVTIVSYSAKRLGAAELSAAGVDGARTGLPPSRTLPSSQSGQG